MIPQRYLIATLFIAAMLALVMIVRVPKPEANAAATPVAAEVVGLAAFEPEAEVRLLDGWSPRFSGAQDPDQWEPWPFEGGFGLPWEPASPYLEDQGLALNGPRGEGEVRLWRNQEWRRYPFDAALTSVRLRGNRLLVTLRLAPQRFETRLMEIPEGRVLWSTPSGPWSRFAWDGSGVLLGAFEPGKEKDRGPQRLLLTVLPLDGEPQGGSLAPWDEKELPAPPPGWPKTPEALSDDGRDLPGPRVVVPWTPGSRLAFPRRDRLWVGGEGHWIAWNLTEGVWRRAAEGQGSLFPQPPRGLGLVKAEGEEAARLWSPPDRANFEPTSRDAAPWPAPDPAWAWTPGGALTAWDLRWGALPEGLAAEVNREALAKAFRADWLAASRLRASVRGWLPAGPEIALRELQGAAWVWVGDRVILARLPESTRLRTVRKLLKP
ncbi:MAG TPA: hypothetical protein VJ623_15380 [Holophagaceae bacterium]|nr:hypothetical protein [Holophagaceae bacterium]